MTSDISAILAKHKPRRETVRLMLDGELEGRISSLRAQIKRAKAREAIDSQTLSSVIPGLEEELARLEAEADEASTVFTFQAIPRPQLEELQRNHPPSEEQWERYKQTVADVPVIVALNVKVPDVDWLGIGPALIAACAVDPKMTRDEAQKLWDQLSDAECAALFDAAWKVNQKTATRPFSGTDTVMTPSFGPSSITPQNEESLSLSLAEGS